MRDLNESQISRGLFIGAYLVTALFLAYWVGVQEVNFVVISLAAICFIILILTLQREVWVLILLGWSLSSATAIFPLPLSIRDVTVLLTACAYIGLRALSLVQVRLKLHTLDVILYVNIAYLGFTFLLNPVGLRAFGAETIGGRPYFTIFLAVIGYWVIGRLPNSIKTVSRIPLYILAGTIVATSLYVVAYLFPSVPSQIPYLYMALNVDAYFAGAGPREVIVRYKELSLFGSTLLVVLYAYFPFFQLLNPLRLPFYGLLGGAMCVLLSGFRSVLAGACVMFGICTWLWGRLSQFLLAALVGGVLLIGIAAGQGRLYNLPPSAQRSLSFLPGRWSADVLQDAEWSSEGRFQWWRDVFRYHLIKDWWCGDGFGANELDVELASRDGAAEMAVVTGALHSGPLTAVRYVGVIGLLLFYALSITAAVYAYRCVQKCRGTILQPVAIYLAAQLIWYPIAYTFIFGAYNTDMPEMIFLTALVRLLWRMADDAPSETIVAEGQLVNAPGTLARTAP